MKNIKQSVGAVIGVLALIAAVIVGVQSAHATGGNNPEPCVPSEAWTEEVIVTPAIPATEGTPEVPAIPPTYETVVVTPASPGFWTNFQPTNSHEPFVGPPTYPTDPRGTWSDPKVEGGPQQDASGVYSNGNPDKGGNWFYREQPKPAVTEQVMTDPGSPAIPAIPGTPAIPAEIEYVDHPAVICDEPTDDPTPSDNPTDNPTNEPTDPTPSDNPTDNPTNEPTPQDPAPVVPEPDTPSQGIEQRCLAGALVTETFEDGHRTNVSIEHGHPRCAPKPGDQPIIEEGM